MARLLKPNSSGSGSSGKPSSSGGSSSSSKKGGATKTEGGKDWIQSGTGMWVEKNSDAGKRVQAGAGSSNGSSGGIINNTKTAGAYTGGQTYTGMSASDYLKSGYTPGSAYTSDPWSGSAVGRLKNGMLADRDYLDKNPNATVYPLAYKPHSYQSTVDSAGNVYNHYGQKYGTGGVWTYDELPDHAKAHQDWNYGVSPGYGNPTSSPAYDDAYNWYNQTYGVAADDAHPLSQGKKPGQGSYWAAGGTGIGGPEYRPNQLYYSAPNGNGGYSQVVPGGAAKAALLDQNNQTGLSTLSGTKAIPSTGIYGGGNVDYMSEYKRALQSAESESARAYQRQIEAAVDAINAQRDPLRQQYQQGAQQAYIEAERAKKQLPEALAAQGINGGATESANLAIETSRGNSLNDLTNTYNNALAGLEQSEAQARTSGDMQIAQNAAQYQQMLANAILSAQQQQQQYAQQMAMMNYQNQLDMSNYEKQLQMKARYSGGTVSGGDGVPVFGDDGSTPQGEYVPTIQSAPSLYRTEWDTGGKKALFDYLIAKGLSTAQISDEFNRLGIK